MPSSSRIAHDTDAELFASPTLPPAQPDAAILAACRGPSRFTLTRAPHGATEGRYALEPTGRNTELDALLDLVEAAEAAGFEALISVDACGKLVRITEARPHRWGIDEGPHDEECECSTCMPEEQDVAERLAGQSDRVAA